MTTLVPKYDQGATGAVNRAFNLKLAEVISVKDFGAVGDGTTDDTVAIQAAITSLGAYTRGTIYFPKGAYKITSSISIGGSSSAYPIVIEGVGQGTQIINAASASNPTFNCQGSHWSIKNLLLTGNSTNPNDGIHVGGTFATIRWNIENVVCQMAGIGIVLNNTNTGIIRDFKNWPDSNDNSLTVAQTVDYADISHGIYATGGFAHDVSIYDADCVIRDGFGATVCGIKYDTSSNSSGVRIIGGLFQGGAADSRYGLFMSRCTGLIVTGAYHETSVLLFSNCVQGFISGTGTGDVGGEINLVNNTIGMTFTGNKCARLVIADATSIQNTFQGCYFSSSISTFTTEADLPTTLFSNMTNYIKSSIGGIRYSAVTYSANMTPNCHNGDIFVITPTNGTAFTITQPSNGINGVVIKITVRNATGGALGAITWDAQYKMSAWTNPANGFSRTVEFYHDKTYGSGANWIQSSQTVDIPN